MKNIFLSLSLIIISTNLIHAQLVNVESKRLQNDTTRFATVLRASYMYKQSNTTTFSLLNGSATIQARSKSLKDIFLALGSYDLTKSNSNNINNAGFVHLRYTRKFNDFLRWGAFAQNQTHEKLKIDNRTLIGTGPRFKLVNKPNFKSSLGTLYMYEIEETLEDNPQQNLDHRLSSYFTFTYAFPNDICELNSITYYQPVVNNFSDCRITNQTSLSFKVIKQVSFEVSVKYLYDTSPPEGVISHSFASKMGVKVSF